MAANTRCSDVVLLDVSGLSPVTDFFIIATGTSPRQMKSVCEESEEFGDAHDFRPHTRAGYEGETWMLVDFIDVVLHVFSADARKFYDLENLWGDAKKLDWQAPAAT